MTYSPEYYNGTYAPEYYTAASAPDVAGSYCEYHGCTNVWPIYISGPADTPEKRRFVIPYGDDYAADIPITLTAGIDWETCTAVLAMSKLDEPNVRLQKSVELHETLGDVYVRFDLDQVDYPRIKPGRYSYDIEVRTVAGIHGTKVLGSLRIVKTFVR